MAKTMTIEESFTEINRIIAEMEDGSQSLEEALASFEARIKLIKQCNKQIDKVEKKIQVLSESGEISGISE